MKESKIRGLVTCLQKGYGHSNTRKVVKRLSRKLGRLARKKEKRYV